MNKIKLNILSPWAFLITLVMFVTFISVIALANDEDPVVGYTHDGLPVYQSEVDDAEALAQLQLDRLLNIDIKGIQKVDTNVLNINTVELFVKDTLYFTNLKTK